MTAAGLDVMTVGYASLDRAFRSARIAGPARPGCWPIPPPHPCATEDADRTPRAGLPSSGCAPG